MARHLGATAINQVVIITLVSLADDDITRPYGNRLDTLQQRADVGHRQVRQWPILEIIRTEHAGSQQAFDAGRDIRTFLGAVRCAWRTLPVMLRKLVERYHPIQ